MLTLLQKYLKMGCWNTAVDRSLTETGSIGSLIQIIIPPNISARAERLCSHPLRKISQTSSERSPRRAPHGLTVLGYARTMSPK